MHASDVVTMQYERHSALAVTSQLRNSGARPGPMISSTTSVCEPIRVSGSVGCSPQPSAPGRPRDRSARQPRTGAVGLPRAPRRRASAMSGVSRRSQAGHRTPTINEGCDRGSGLHRSLPNSYAAATRLRTQPPMVDNVARCAERCPRRRHQGVSGRRSSRARLRRSGAVPCPQRMTATGREQTAATGPRC